MHRCWRRCTARRAVPIGYVYKRIYYACTRDTQKVESRSISTGRGDVIAGRRICKRASMRSAPLRSPPHVASSPSSLAAAEVQRTKGNGTGNIGAVCGARAALLVIDWSYLPVPHYSFKLHSPLGSSSAASSTTPTCAPALCYRFRYHGGTYPRNGASGNQGGTEGLLKTTDAVEKKRKVSPSKQYFQLSFLASLLPFVTTTLS